MMLGLKSGSRQTVSMLSHHVIARYFKFVPKLLEDAWACMRLELYGCDSNKGKFHSIVVKGHIFDSIFFPKYYTKI